MQRKTAGIRVDSQGAHTMTQPASDLPKTSRPATQALATIGVTRLEQLTLFSEVKIAGLHGMGPKALGILRAALAARGLTFAEK
jgi:hypothetical protein